MLFFIKRYLTWYFWLGLYTTAAGALVGILIFCISPFLPMIVILLPRLYPIALAFAAPLNLIVLPVVFHAFRGSARRRRVLRLAGAIGGFFSPIPAFVFASGLKDLGAWPGPFGSRDSLSNLALGSVGFVVVGAIAGFVCGGMFDKRGDKASIFDINDALDSVRRKPSGSPTDERPTGL